MKLDSKQFKRFKELMAKAKDGSATQAELAELEELKTMKNSRGSNDISWWKNYPELLKDVTNIAFNYIPGTENPITGVNGTNGTLNLGVIVKAVLRPSIGLSVSDADPFNAQIRQLWLDLHRKYRGIGTYEKSDLGIAILAINGLFETIAKFERLYGVINTYHIGNRTVPYGLKEALGISNDLEENLADFRYSLNLVITKAKQLCLPKGLSVLESDIVAISNLFKDSSDRRALTFFFDQDVYAVYSPTLLPNSGGCVGFKRFSAKMTGFTPGNRSAFTLADINSILNDALNALINDDDVARMCSDLLAAYGPENVMTLLEIPEGYKVEPVEDYERKVQFHNLTIVSDAQTIYDLTLPDVASASDANAISATYPIVIYQNNNVIVNRLGVSDDSANYAATPDGYHPTLNYGSYGTWYGKENDVIFDTWVENPTEVEVMCGTRYVSMTEAITAVASSVYRSDIRFTGTKVCTKVIVYGYQNHAYNTMEIKGSVMPFSNVTSNVFGFMRLLQMDWAPILYVADNSSKVQIFGDIDNFARIERVTLDRLHEVALLSGYKIPMVSQVK